MIHIRPCGVQDAGPIADMINEIINAGGAIARTDPATRDWITAWITRDPRTVSIVAEDDAGELLGFQAAYPHADLGDHVAQIGTYTRVGRTGLGTGSKMFEAFKPLCRTQGYSWINAEIRADNDSGLIYYQSRGFEDYGRIENVTLADGSTVDKILKRYDL